MTELEHQLRNEIERLEDQVRMLGSEVLSLRHFIRSLQNIADAVDRVGVAGEIMELLAHILRNALSSINVSDGSLLVLDEKTQELVFVLAYGNVPQEQIAGYRLPQGKGIAGWVAQHREATIVEDAQSDRRFYKGVDDAFQFHTRSILAAPIVGGGRVLGVIEVLNKDQDQGFTVDDLTLLTLVCRFAGELLQSIEKQARKTRP